MLLLQLLDNLVSFFFLLLSLKNTFAREGFLSVLLEILSDAEDSSVVERASWALFCMVDGNSAVQELVVELDMLPLILHMLSNPDTKPRVLLHELSTLSVLMRGNERTLDLANQLGSVKVLTTLAQGKSRSFRLTRPSPSRVQRAARDILRYKLVKHGSRGADSGVPWLLLWLALAGACFAVVLFYVLLSPKAFGDNILPYLKDLAWSIQQGIFFDEATVEGWTVKE